MEKAIILMGFQKSRHTYHKEIQKSGHTYVKGISKSGRPYLNGIEKIGHTYLNGIFKKAATASFIICKGVMARAVGHN
jgi:hypothetical protein